MRRLHRRASSYARALCLLSLCAWLACNPSNSQQPHTQDAGATERTPCATVTWRFVLLLVKHSDYTLDTRVKSSFSVEELEALEASFRALPALVSRLTFGQVRITQHVVHLDKTVTDVQRKNGHLRLAPPQQQTLLATYDKGEWDAIALAWKRGSFDIATWGQTYALSPGGSTLFFLNEAPENIWRLPPQGEPFLHGWAHGLDLLFRARGFGAKLPPEGAEADVTFGYKRDPKEGWSAFYRDLLNGTIPYKGNNIGFTCAMWSTGPARHTP